MKKTLVVYHSADFDGIACREVARRFIKADGDHEVEYVGWNFGDPVIPIPTEGEVLVMDLPMDRPFGFMFGAARGNKEQMEAELAQQHGKDLARFTWIDHHKSSIETHPTTIPGFRIDGVAACRLAYAWFFRQTMFPRPEEEPLPTKQNFVDRQVTEPMAITLIGEHDVWDHRDPLALRFQYGLRAYDVDKIWPKLLHLEQSGIEIMPIMEAGIYCQRYATNVDASICEHRTFLIEWEGLRWLCLNSARFNSQSFAARDMRETGHDALLGFCWDGKCWQVSLYHAAHNTNIDLSEIAKKYGGGGHRGACGFTAKTLPLPL